MGEEEGEKVGEKEREGTEGEGVMREGESGWEGEKRGGERGREESLSSKRMPPMRVEVPEGRSGKGKGGVRRE